MKIRNFALILSACFALLCFASCDFGVVRKEYKPTDDAYFNFTLETDGTYAISAKDVSSLPSQINLPSEHNGKPVSSVSAEGFIGSKIAKLVVPDGYKSIGERAFKGCASLKTASFGSVVTIKNQAFSECEALTNVNFPTALEEIGNFAFSKTAVKSVKLVNVKTIGTYAFYGCQTLKEVYIPSSTVSIGDMAFEGIDAKVLFDVASANENYKVEDGIIVEK